MQFVALSDIQANMLALQAVLDDIEQASPGIDRIVSVGDQVGRGPHPNEVLAVCRERSMECVLGNYDDAVAYDRLGSGTDFPDEAEERADVQAIAWTKQNLTPENMAFLRSLPRDVRLYTGLHSMSVKRNTGDAETAEHRKTFASRMFLGSLLGERQAPRTRRIQQALVVHGSPRALNEFVREDIALSIATRISQEARADLIITGHAEEPYHKVVGNTHFVGVGSVSGPHGRSGRADYAVLDVGPELQVEFRTVEYDAVAYVQALRERGLAPLPS